MIRGTTPTHEFTIPFDTEQVEKVRIIYVQGGVERFVKTEVDCTMAGKVISCRLTQEDTLSLTSDNCVEIQLRVLTVAGDAFASQIMKAHVCACLEDEVLA